MRLVHNSNCSQVDLKVKVFSLSLDNSNTLTGIFRSSLVSKDLIKKFEFLQNKQITFTNLYEFFYQETEAEEVEILVKYNIHYMQFSHEIVSELSEANNLSMQIVYNSIRFIVIYFVLLFA